MVSSFRKSTANMFINVNHGRLSLRNCNGKECQYGDLLTGACTEGKTTNPAASLRSRDGLVCDLLYEDTKTTKSCSVCLWPMFAYGRHLFTAVFVYGSCLTTAIKTITVDHYGTAKSARLKRWIERLRCQSDSRKLPRGGRTRTRKSRAGKDTYLSTIGRQLTLKGKFPPFIPCIHRNSH